jgi:hypothetical protein
VNFDNTVEIIKHKAEYGDIFIFENEDGNLYICRTPSIKEFKAWSDVCSKLDLNPAMTSMSIAYITQVYPEDKMPEDVALVIGSDIINSAPVSKDDMRAEFESHSSFTVIDWLVYSVWQFTGIETSKLESMSISEMLKLYKAACDLVGAPSVFEVNETGTRQKGMFENHQTAEQMNSKFEELKSKFENIGIDIENINI